MQNNLKARLKTDFNWNTSTFMVLFHVGAISALFFFSWKAIAASLLLAWIAGSLGVGVGFHRLLTHRGFKTPKLVEYFLTFCGALALQGGAINWVVTHRIHHAFTESLETASPAKHWWATWVDSARSHSDEVMQRYAPDLQDPVRPMNRLYLWLILCGIVLAVGILRIDVGVFFRPFILCNPFVNSATTSGEAGGQTTDS